MPPVRFPARLDLARRPTPLVHLPRTSAALGVELDPVYTGKAFYGLVRELARDRNALGERVVFVHTGGIFGLFPAAAELADVL